MKNVKFLPWVGNQYRNNKTRLLLLGESHYSDSPQSNHFTQELIEQYLDGEYRHRYWTQIIQLLSGAPHGEVNSKEAIQPYAFYNFIQEIVSDSPEVKPTRKMIDDSIPAFWEVIEELQPTHILVLSKRLWDYLPAGNGFDDAPLLWDGQDRDTWVYPSKINPIYVTWVRHPSYGFNALTWAPLVQLFLERSRK
ncbi:hypothetical protein L9W80_15490 [Vibrio aestuarianus]|jgi:hypothetical protein|uniref:hypothetical protein n=1 Tax=Vibrio aestuarianus TaxID=28171 RepID=UPI00237CEDDB|nr:hypothetical protein [Vibrio aestuarianus]MDE1351549.1 hypothetical protein [Vibrio aestuarianus]